MNNKNINSMIFDLDGTLIDTIADIGNSVNDILNKFNYKKIKGVFVEKKHPNKL